jgi:hypothetical protein
VRLGVIVHASGAGEEVVRSHAVLDAGDAHLGGLLKAAVEYARSQEAAVVEAYPVEPGSRLYTYMGSPWTFRRAGFHDVTPAG